VLKARSKILLHNSKLGRKKDVPDAFRDRGLTRVSVLIVVPFRESALAIVHTLMSLLTPSGSSKKSVVNVLNKKRFLDEYSSNRDVPPDHMPDDYIQTFTGNVDDAFRIGVGVTKNSLKLYNDFYTSDIIIASPLGLRTLIGAEGESSRDYDFLNSVELLIFDQADLFLMQNWDHVDHIMSHLHLQPTSAHDADFSRVRMWALRGWSRYTGRPWCSVD